MKTSILLVQKNDPLSKILLQKLAPIEDLDLLVASSMSEASGIIGRRSVDLAVLDLELVDAKDGEIAELFASKKIPSILLNSNYDIQLQDRFMNNFVIDMVLKNSEQNIDYIVSKIDRVMKNRSHKVLIADSSRSSRYEMRIYLQSQLFSVVEARGVADVLEALETHRDLSMVLLDSDGENGVDLCVALRSMNSKEELAIIGVSKESSTSVAFLRMGADDFLHKPFSRDEFVCRVNNSIEALENIQRIRYLSVTDYMTGAFNRRYFMDNFEQYHAMALQKDIPLSVAMIDIDNFKSVNDTYGHSVGDDVIKFLASSLKKSVSGADIVARLGGEEFSVLLKDKTPDKAEQMMEDARCRIESAVLDIDEARELSFSVSIGLTHSKLGSHEEMLDLSDALLYEAKRSGKNRVVAG